MPDGEMPPGLPADYWRQIFADERPVAIEIGPGRGEFLLASARANPQRNFFAIEHSHGSTRRILEAIEAAGLTNARVICGDATCVVELLPAASVAAFHILFPDPWWKRRHKRRLLITPRFVAALGRALMPDGRVEFVTDVPDYFDLAQKTFAAAPALELVERGRAGDIPTTFARKARQQGALIQRSLHRRTASPV